MKKLIVLVVIALTVIATDSFAQNGKGKSSAPKTNWVDANNDGVCDNNTGTAKMNQGKVRPNFIDANGDGICDNAGSCTGKRVNFVDANGDGVCDNMGSGTCKGMGAGKKGGMGKRNGSCGTTTAPKSK